MVFQYHYILPATREIVTDYDNGADSLVPVPSCWETYPDTVSYRGQASFSRDFEASGNIRLEFKGVSHTAKVFVDNEPVATHYNAFTPFDAILKNLKPGTHHLEVLVDNSFSSESSLHIPNDYQTYGGISRGVVLKELDDIYISWIHFTPVKKDGQWYGKAECHIHNLSDRPFEGFLKLALNENTFGTLDVKLEAQQELTVCTEEILFSDAAAWTMENPVLYLLSGKLLTSENVIIDDLIDRVGFREVRIEQNKILLNDREIRIKGFCRHEDHPQFGCALPFSAMQYDLMLAKDMGANSIRTAHYPNDEIFLDLCLGLPEVVSYNIYPKWYEDMPVNEFLKELYDWIQNDTKGCGKPFLITETGAGAIYSYRTPAHVKWSEEYQAETLEEQICTILSHEGCCGIYIWQFCDVRVCDSWFFSRPRTMNNKGIVDEYRRPKLAYEVVKRLYSSYSNYRA